MDRIGKEPEINTPASLRQKFLDMAPTIMDKIYLAYTSPQHPRETLSAMEKQYMDYAWPTLHTIITTAGDILKIKANTAQDVVKAMGRGKITPEEAEKMLKVFETEQELGLLPDIARQLQELTGNKGQKKL